MTAVEATGTPAPLILSVVICTWNRADMLADTIDSVFACDCPRGSILDVIVVDNASSDHTAKVIESRASTYQFTQLFEPRPGLSNARNSGVGAARGSWILFLDDDVLLPANFITNYVSAIRSITAAAFLAGGVVATFDHPTPPWVQAVLKNHWWCFSSFNIGPPTRELSPEQTPFGANMALRRDVADRFAFSALFGYKHGALIPGEETELFERIRDQGFRGFWVADVALKHRLPADRWRAPYLMRRAFGQGVADVYRRPNRRRHALRYLLAALRDGAVMAGRAILGRPTWACAMIESCRSAGSAISLLTASRRALGRTPRDRLATCSSLSQTNEKIDTAS